MHMPDRSVFFISDGTGITAETMGNSVLAQFAVKPRHVRRPFIDTVDKAHQVVREINAAAEREGKLPKVMPLYEAAAKPSRRFAPELSAPAGSRGAFLLT